MSVVWRPPNRRPNKRPNKRCCTARLNPNAMHRAFTGESRKYFAARSRMYYCALQSATAASSDGTSVRRDSLRCLFRWRANRDSQALCAVLSQIPCMRKAPCFQGPDRCRCVRASQPTRCIVDASSDCTPLGLQLYLHAVLAFVGDSLYRTRRFRSLCATAGSQHDLRASLKPDKIFPGHIDVLGDSARARLLSGVVLQVHWILVRRGELNQTPATWPARNLGDTTWALC